MEAPRSPMVPLYGFVSAGEYEAILVHHFSILNHDYVCVDTAKEIEKWLHELQNEVKNLSSVLRFNVEIHFCCMWRLFIFQKTPKFKTLTVQILYNRKHG